MDRFHSFAAKGKQKARIRRELLVFAWNLRSLATPFAQRSLALNAIERGRAWHWRLLPAGWADTAFILRHGQHKTKRAFSLFFTSFERTELQPPKRTMRIRKAPGGETPLNWETVKSVFAQNPKLKQLGVLAGAQALLNEHLENKYGRFSFDIDLHTPRELQQVHALLTPDDRKRIRLVSRTNPEMFVYEIGTRAGAVKLEVAKPYLIHKLAPAKSKHIPGLKVTHFADLIDAKISALSTRGFARDFVDLYAADEQKRMDWRRLLINASKNSLNDYNPIELENNLKLLEQEFQHGTQGIPCERPPKLSDLVAFLEDLRAVNAEVARELTQPEGSNGDESDTE
jgi:predicted nucleotidyltransferase component of viral defense system